MKGPVTERGRWSGALYGRFLGVVVATLAVLAGCGYALSVSRGDEAVRAVLAALAATGLASAVSGIPLAVSGGPPQAMLNRSLIAMLIRLVVVAGLAAFCVLVLKVDRAPYLISLVVAYLALLAVDTGFAVKASRSAS